VTNLYIMFSRCRSYYFDHTFHCCSSIERCYRDKTKMKNIIIASRIDPGERRTTHNAQGLFEELGYRVYLHQTCDMSLHLTSIH